MIKIEPKPNTRRSTDNSMAVTKSSFVPEFLNYVYAEPLEHLSDDLVGALDEDLDGPPLVRRHMVQEPLSGRLGSNEAPLEHRTRDRKWLLISR